MLSPSDFNNAVPQFTNGNYASNPINPQYIAEPDAESYNRGTEPLQTLPAQWWNWFLNKFTARFNKVNIYVKNIFNELAQVLSIFNITPDGTEQAPTTSQLKTVFECCYPQYVKNDLYGNTVGTALGTAAVGTCTTFARSDHVHASYSNRTFIVEASDNGCWNEGVRINRNNNNTAALFIGGTNGSKNGCDQVFSMVTPPGETDKLDISWAGSNYLSYFQGLSDHSVIWHGNVCGCLYGTADLAVGSKSFIVNPEATGGFQEGIRINESCGNGTATLLIGSNYGSTNDVCNAFWLGVNHRSYGQKLFINYNTYEKDSYFEACADGSVSWHGNVTGNLAGTADCACQASGACTTYLIGANTWMSWQWDGCQSQPDWVWGANSSDRSHVYNPSCFSVAYAANAGCAETAANANNVNNVSGTLTINPGSATNYGEGLRINRATTGFTTLLIGSEGGTQGVCGGFWLGTSALDPGKLWVNYNSSQQNSFFQNNGDGTVSWHGNVVGDLNGTACYARCLHFEQLTNNTACPVYYFYANGKTYLCATGPAMMWITNPYGVPSSSPSIYKAGVSEIRASEGDPGLSYIKF